MEGLLEHLQTAPATLWTAPNPFHRETLTLLLMSTQLKAMTVSGDRDILILGYAVTIAYLLVHLMYLLKPDFEQC